jgi:hypothetical protein
MVADPRFFPVASPLTAMLKTLVSEELHDTEPVMSCVLPSENVPVAVNCCDAPNGIEALEGVTAMETSDAPVTVKVAVAETLPDVAVIVELPAASPFASPEAPFTLMLATPVLLEVQVTRPVALPELPSLKVALAVNWKVVFSAIVWLVGEILREVMVGEVTVSVTLPFTPARAALMVAVPAATPVAMPVFETVAMLVLEEVQVAVLVTSCVLPSLYEPVALSWVPVPAATEGALGVIWIDVNLAPPLLPPPEDFVLAQPASSTALANVNKSSSFFIVFIGSTAFILAGGLHGPRPKYLSGAVALPNIYDRKRAFFALLSST